MKLNSTLLAGAIVAGLMGGSVFAQDGGAAGTPPPTEAPAPAKAKTKAHKHKKHHKKDKNGCKGMKDGAQ